jgi:hypothetical protein
MKRFDESAGDPSAERDDELPLRARMKDADPEVAWAARLLEAARPPAPGARRDRVWAALARRERRPAYALLLQPAVVAVVLVGGAAVAGATFGPRLVARIRDGRVRSEPSTSPMKPMKPMKPMHIDPTRPGGAPATQPGAAPATVPMTAPAQVDQAIGRAEALAPSVAPRPERVVREHRAAASTVRPDRSVDAPTAAPPKSSAPAAVVDGDDEPHPSPPPDVAGELMRHAANDPGVDLVVAALGARGHDPARAAELLAEYRLRYPDGSLAEEALVLAIEAAVKQGDPSARGLASRYLDRYPSGRWAETARRVIARAAAAH